MDPMQRVRIQAEGISDAIGRARGLGMSEWASPRARSARIGHVAEGSYPSVHS